MVKYTYVSDAGTSRIFANQTNRDDQVKYTLDLTQTGPRRTPVEIVRYGIVKTKPRVSLPDGTSDTALAVKTTDTVRISVSGAYASLDQVFIDVDHAVALFKEGQQAAMNRFLISMNAEPKYNEI